MDESVMTEKILITGANGFTGKHACHYFSKKGMKVIAAVRRDNNICNHSVKQAVCDLTKKNEIELLLRKEKPYYILHLAGQNDVSKSWNHPHLTMETNAFATLHLLDAVRQENFPCKIIVVTSALQYDMKIDKYPPHPYSLSKSVQSIISESWSEFFNLEIIIAKPNNLIGPGDSNGVCSLIAKKIVDYENNKSKDPIVINDSSIHRDFLDVRDAVKAYDYLFQRGKRNEIYNVASGKSQSLGDLIYIYRELSNTNFPVSIKKSSKEISPVQVDISKLKALGWSPRIPFRTSLQDILDYYRKKAVKK
ncbi:NAD-dependent epimerase/dehydratase family protein [Aliibacillus thermotolerans]|nr:NAD-dependent epimerase/dehydratase family protein [Aliibacillus thermotolerans]